MYCSTFVGRNTFELSPIDKGWRWDQPYSGDPGPASGIVFYVDENNDHDWTYLEVWTADESGGTHQQKTTASVSSPTSLEIGTGYEKTYTAMSGNEYPAAVLARQATYGGKSDWFLPSKDELNAIWVNLVHDGQGGNNGTGNFLSAVYWSSSGGQVSTGQAQSFSNGAQYTHSKDDSHKVRVVRAF